jgi:coenzyme F420-reducing hydrogenase alpha subunit
MSSVHAMEDAFGVTVGGQLRALRRLIYCGEWIESHALHVFMLHAPDFLGYDDAIAMASDHPDIVNSGLRMKKVGNDLVALLGGREIHPINVRVGGFYRVPTRRELRPIVEALKPARDAAAQAVRWTASLPFPDFERDYTFVALRHPDEYPFNKGRIVSNTGLDTPARAFDDHFEEHQVEYSHALHSVLKGQGSYLVGPLARYNLNFDRLSPVARELAGEVGLSPPVLNPFKSIIVRCVETLHACEEALRILDDYEPPDRPYVEVEPRMATGHGCTEAPRGILYHRYELDDEGVILDARIVPPTSQNQKSMEDDLWSFIPSRLSLPKKDLTWQCEQLIRSYDPCISCSTHFLDLEVERG